MVESRGSVAQEVYIHFSSSAYRVSISYTGEAEMKGFVAKTRDGVAEPLRRCEA